MNNIKTGYAYLFFFIYKYLNKKNNIFIQPKSIFVIVVLEFFLAFSFFVCYGNITKTTILPENFNILNLLYFIIPVVGLNLWFFERKDNWKRYIDYFNSWPPKRQNRWNWVMRIILFSVFATIVFSFYWLSQIDWKKYG